MLENKLDGAALDVAVVDAAGNKLLVGALVLEGVLLVPNPEKREAVAAGAEVLAPKPENKLGVVVEAVVGGAFDVLEAPNKEAGAVDVEGCPPNKEVVAVLLGAAALDAGVLLNSEVVVVLGAAAALDPGVVPNVLVAAPVLDPKRFAPEFPAPNIPPD